MITRFLVVNSRCEPRLGTALLQRKLRKRVRLTIVLQIGQPFTGPGNGSQPWARFSTNLGFRRSLPAACRSFFTAVLTPCSKSTKVSSGHSATRNCSRVTTLPFAFQQQTENLERLLLNPNRSTLWCTQVTAAQIDLELVKASTKSEDDLEVATGTLHHVVVHCTLNTFAEYHSRYGQPKIDTSPALLTPTLPDSHQFTFCTPRGSPSVHCADCRRCDVQAHG